MSKTNDRVRFTAPEEGVRVRVLPQGAGRIFTGEEAEVAATYARGDLFSVGPAIAAELEARGLVEIQP
jgi:hypothetical protein